MDPVFTPAVAATVGSAALGAGGNMAGSVLNAGANIYQDHINRYVNAGMANSMRGAPTAASQYQVDAGRAGQGYIDQGAQAAGAAYSPYTQAGSTAVGGLGAYQDAGASALQQQQALAGLLGPEAQQQAIQMLQASPQYQSMVQQGEAAILQNASATGGLRGGNTQAMLAQFRPQMLSQLINQQYERLGGLSALGQQTGMGVAGLGANAAAGTAGVAQTAGAQKAAIEGDIGAAQSGASMDEAKLKAQAEAPQYAQQGSDSFWGGIGNAAGEAAKVAFIPGYGLGKTFGWW